MVAGPFPRFPQLWRSSRPLEGSGYHSAENRVGQMRAALGHARIAVGQKSLPRSRTACRHHRRTETVSEIVAPSQDLEVAFCDLKLRVSSAVSWNMKSGENRSILRVDLLVEALRGHAVKVGEVLV